MRQAASLPAFQSTHPVWGATPIVTNAYTTVDKFQSTHPVWGATHLQGQSFFATGYFNPRTPCGVRRRRYRSRRGWCGISIHAPRVGCDDFNVGWLQHCGLFQSTHPVWGATIMSELIDLTGKISIHAPRVGCDLTDFLKSYRLTISIHAPRVGCDGMPNTGSGKSPKFQSTHPVWGATFSRPVWARPNRNFNPRTPCGVRLVHECALAPGWVISIHAPRVGCD